MKGFACFAVALTLCLFPLSASAQGSAAQWKEVGGWLILVDTSIGNKCFVANAYEEGTILRLGFWGGLDDGSMYFGVGNDKWASLEDGKTYPLEIQIDDTGAWPSPATVTRTLGYPMLLVNTQQPDFIIDIAKRHSLRVFYENRLIVNLSLRGSYAAVTEWLECQKAMEGVEDPRTSDPFASSRRNASNDDPFAN